MQKKIPIGLEEFQLLIFLITTMLLGVNCSTQNEPVTERKYRVIDAQRKEDSSDVVKILDGMSLEIILNPRRDSTSQDSLNRDSVVPPNP